MDKRKKALLLGLVIGDGYISPTGQLSYRHCLRQKEYLEHKVDLLHSVLGGKKPKITEVNNNGYPGVVAYKTNKKLRIIRNLLYVNGRKEISSKILNLFTPQEIALWYMDDGCLSLKKRNGKIHARDIIINTYLTKEQNQIIIDYFNEAHNIRFTQVKSKSAYRIRCGTNEGKKFISLVKPYIIPSMHYKIDMKYPNQSTKAGHPQG